MAKKNKPQQQVSQWADELNQTLNQWKNHYKYGCNDPSWADGVNMNLLRNHIFYFKKQISEACKGNQIQLPPEYFLPIPPKVDPNYFANPKSERAIRIINNFGRCYSDTTEKAEKFNDTQLVLF